MDIEIVKLGASKLNPNTNSPQWQALNDVGPDPGDSEDFGDIDIFQALGVSSMPWPADDESYAEAAVVRNCGNRDGICIGARDTRTSSAFGAIKPGDTILHSTGPNQAAQVQCKEEKRQVVMYTKDSSGKGVIGVIDGKNDQIQFAGFGMIIEMTKKNGIKLHNGQASILLQGGDIYLNGNLHLPGMLPNQVLQSGAPLPSSGGPAALPTVPVRGTGR